MFSEVPPRITWNSGATRPDFLFEVPYKAKQFAEDGLNAAGRYAVRTEVTAGAKNAQGGAGIAKMQAAAAAATGR